MARSKARSKKNSKHPTFVKEYTTDDGKATIKVCLDENTNREVDAFTMAILASRGIRPANAISVNDEAVRHVRKTLFKSLGTNDAMKLALQAVRDHHAAAEQRIAMYVPFVVMLSQSFPLKNGQVICPPGVEIDPPDEDYFWTPEDEAENRIMPRFRAYDNELERRLYYAFAFMDENVNLWEKMTDDIEAFNEANNGSLAEVAETDDAGFQSE